MNKISKEWFVEVPWGNISLVSWGNPSGVPALLVHGRQDSAATFISILEHLPDKYYYVAVDLPGHGKSDPLPLGVMITRCHFLASVDFAIKHLKWKHFIYIGHSMGCEKGLFYNAIYPNRITKFVFFDPIPSFQRLQINDIKEYYHRYYKEFYDNYAKYMHDDRVYSRRQALDAVMKARGLNEHQAEVVLSRNLKQIGEDKYKLAWDRRLKFPAPQNYPLEYYCELFSTKIPILMISASQFDSGYAKGRDAALKLVKHMKEYSPVFFEATVEGGHDVHLTSPEAVAALVVPFLNKNLNCKL
ncbi:hypothetical protein ACJJTC_002609 [Scirpophaga incertulas]